MTWTAPQVDRRTAPYVADERTLLQGMLDQHRDLLLAKCAGLTAEQLTRAAVEPSNLTLLGLVRHMTDVERSWFRQRAAGQKIGSLYYTEEQPDTDFEDLDTAGAEAAFAALRAECDAADRAVAHRGLDDTFETTDGRVISLRWMYVHMIEEYARHNGHADLLRERIDGATGE
ncbi:DinB family protein [Streptomyces sp. NPDC052496]|uniref:DinB family protein n=1 Tax=Streptomyces sp. NPDC052496 TaxID=3154951 RepID=UPI00342C17F1